MCTARSSSRPGVVSTRHPLGADPPGVGTPSEQTPHGTRHPPVNRMTNRCKNITLPQTSFAGGNNLNKKKLFRIQAVSGST